MGGEGWLKNWKEGEIMLIIKKGEGKRVEDYRKVSIMSSVHKVYAMVLTERLSEEMELKGVLSRSQSGFKKGMETTDSVYVLNYLVNRQLSKRRQG